MMSESGVEIVRDTGDNSIDESNNAENGVTSRERVAQTLSGALPVSRKRRIARVSTEGEEEGSTDMLVRALDRAIRWNAFLFSVNLLWAEIIKSVYGNDIDMDSDTVIGARNKIFDNTKAYKWNVLRSMEVSVNSFSKMKGRASNLRK
jgi:hypothetical protein